MNAYKLSTSVLVILNMSSGFSFFVITKPKSQEKSLSKKINL